MSRLRRAFGTPIPNWRSVTLKIEINDEALEIEV